MSRNRGCRGHEETSKEKQELDALDRVRYWLNYLQTPRRINVYSQNCKLCGLIYLNV